MYLLAILINALIGGTLARMYGAGDPPQITSKYKIIRWLYHFYAAVANLPKLVLNALCVLPFVLATGLITFSPFCVIAFLGMFGIATGHGQYFSMGEKTISPEKVDPLVRLFFGIDPRTQGRLISYYGFAKLRWRNSFGMFIIGSMVGLPASLICAYLNEPKAAILLSLTGVVKAAAYRFSPHNEAAEWFNGFFRTMLCGLAVAV